MRKALKELKQLQKAEGEAKITADSDKKEGDKDDKKEKSDKKEDITKKTPTEKK